MTRPGPLGKIWTREMASSISRDDLAAFHAREIVPDSMAIYLVGDAALDDAEAALEKAFGKWKAKSASRLRGVGEAQDAARQINMNLREDKGWSYGMRSRLRSNPSGDQTLAVSGGVQTDKTPESMAEIMKEYAEFVSSRPAAAAAELERVVENRTRSLPGSFSTGFTFLASMSRSARFGLSLDHAETAASRVRAVTLDAVNTTAKQLINPGKLTWDAYGNRIR